MARWSRAHGVCFLLHSVYEAQPGQAPKSREPLLSDDIRPELRPYMATILKGKDSSAILINSVEDHAHVLFHLSKNHALCDVIESVKKNSSKWIKTKCRAYRSIHGQ